MKKMRLFGFLLLLAVMLTACGGGNVRHVKPVIGPSELYSDSEILAAMDIAVAQFKREFDGCTLTRLEYDEDRVRDEQAGWAEQYGTDEAIVLLSDFDVDGSGGDGSLNPNDTYRSWKWVLTRSDGGAWTLRTWGYG